jgi:serine/threonine protein kinase
LENSVLNLTVFEDGFDSDYRRWAYVVLVVMKFISFSALIKHCEIETKIENLMNLRHPTIAQLISFSFCVESGGCREFKTARLHGAEGSLVNVFFSSPAWWTPTTKGKGVAGIALSLRFLYSLGLLHSDLKVSNVLFNADLRIQIVDFNSIRLDMGTAEPFSGEGWSPAADVFTFASLLFEITIGAVDGSSVPAVVPEFVSRMIEVGRSREYQRCIPSPIHFTSIGNSDTNIAGLGS